MFFFFTCGEHTFTSRLKGYEMVTCQCQNCGNFSGHVYKRWQWFTLCFVPLIPMSLKPWHEVGCSICNFYQDIKYRPEVQAQGIGSTAASYPMQNHSQPPPQQQQHPQYK